MGGREGSTTKVNVNTIMLSIVLGVSSWVGYTVHGTSLDVARLGEAMVNVKTQNETSIHDRADIRSRLAMLEIEVARLKDQLDFTVSKK